MLSKIKKLLGSSFAESVGTIPKSYIAQFLHQNAVIVEAGAHAGFDTVEMAKLWPHASIHAFEPIPSLFNTLEKNTRRFKNVTCYPLALGQHVGLQRINVSRGGSDASSSLLKPKRHLEIHPEVVFDQSIEIQTVTLAHWAEGQKLSRIDFMWLDLQGFELQVLRCAGSLIDKVSAIYCEVSLIETYEGCALYPEVRKWLEAKGFHVDREELPWADSGNVLFLKG